MIRQVVGWLNAVPTVTILSFEREVSERGMTDDVESLDGVGSVTANWAQRHVFRDWLVSLLPLAIPLMTLLEQKQAAGENGQAC